ncbi:MAG: tRNA (N(6)-L-threonylcarbamoyladenosine(37)-C(2))-methylthiotransferase MtaB [Candidatus Dadabacteria bacterium]|nr:tRNA (N(6)-L-threonylcarbamoyladenosine(37)-C(2))-methylthiotransferase MtaB [Candidatus Dadabacteria bacterium]NIQ14536.1 tRNA (N(6)-L-threonylcarbamoyladenosine(37)-C(2))-methylthiotransferase MtaB [Candidatus Dadabacteria bacterium]
MKKISVVTLGCKVNQYDTAALLNNLPSGEYHKNDNFDDKADVYVIDTCTVTHKADSEARNYIYRAKRSNPEGVVIVTGCYAQVSSDDLKSIEQVDYVVGNSHKSSLLEVIKQGSVQDEPKVFISDIFKEKKRKFDTPDIRFFPDRTRAFLKVQDGCNYACTFCIIPKARGRSRSLEPIEVIQRLKSLDTNGYKEVVLTGIHLASYGRDIGLTLLDLLKEVEKSKVMKRIRLSSLDPADMNRELIDYASISDVICPSFHIALQSGDKGVLKRMKRRYKPYDFIDCTSYIREKIPDASIGTDIMVGFPGETDEEFINTYELAKESELTYFHVFPYSIRKNTAAAEMSKQVNAEIKKKRSQKMRELGKLKKDNFYKKFIGKTLDAIVENNSKCTTMNYISAKLTNDNFQTGNEIKITLTDVKDGLAYGYSN